MIEIRELEESYEKEFQELISTERKNSFIELDKLKNENKIKLNESLDVLKTEMIEIHSKELKLKIKEMKDAQENEMIMILRDTKNVADEEHSLNTKELIEKIGKQSRESLESQRILLEEERSSEIEKKKKELSLQKENYDNEIKRIKIENLNEIERIENNLKNEINANYDYILKEKERFFERAVEASSVNLGIEKEFALTNLRCQHVCNYSCYVYVLLLLLLLFMLLFLL